jgi:tritrans,polycis-undecaprenyl-diphosphate synthase [geranylgeranyl-diphosphate specific]
MVGEGMHIGIILDGNRRYAKKKNMNSWQGHKFGAEKVKELINWCKELNVRELTLYSFSVENFNRPKKEVQILMKLFEEYLKRLKEEMLKKNQIRIRFIGRIDMFSDNLRLEMEKLMEKTKDHRKYTINFAMAYGGRQEIVDAVKKISKKVSRKELSIDEIDEKTVTENVYLADEPDLIIRPGGEKRVSNFLIWQSYYSEWYFTDKLWPEFGKQDLIEAINEFRQRERRFGR